MKLLILCAGLGSRLRPYTNHTPKTLVKINDKSLLERQIEVAKKFKLEVEIVGGYLHRKLKDYANKIYVNYEYKTTNMLWSLFKALSHIEEEVIISYGDIVYSKKILEKIINCRDDIAIPIDLNWAEYWKTRQSDILIDSETLQFDKNYFLKEIGNKPFSINQIQGQYMGIIKLSGNGCKIFKEEFKKIGSGVFGQDKTLRNAFLTDFLQYLIVKEIKIKVIPHSDNWVEIDTVSDLNSRITKKRLLEIENELKII